MNTLTVMEKVAHANPPTFAALQELLPEVEQSPFKDEIDAELGEIVKKAQAQAPGFMGSLQAPAAAIGATVATGIAYHLAGDLYEATRRGLSRGRDYKAMLKGNPDLAQHSADDTKRIFSTLHRFNPEFAGDPMVSGSFVRDHLQMAGAERGQINLNQLTSLVQARKNLSDSNKLHMPNLPFDVGRKADPLEQEKTRAEIDRTRAQTKNEGLKSRQMGKDMLRPKSPFQRAGTEEMRDRRRNESRDRSKKL